MKMNIAALQKKRAVGRARVITAILAFVTLLVPATAFGIVNIWDSAQNLPDVDNRVGALVPTAAQLTAVNNLGARADWNKFGTINTLIKDNGFLATGLTGNPVDAARQWIRQNRGLFKLSEQAVADLELVNDARMPYNDAHFVLFRQKFGAFAPTQDGQISVSIVNGNIFHVWSSSAGDQPLIGQAALTPIQAWVAAASNVNINIPASSVLSQTADLNSNWTLLDVAGLKQKQQVRLTALPTPSGNARLSYEVNVVNVDGHIADAYTVFVDAQSGDVLYRANRTNYLLPPETTTFQGEYTPQVFPCGGTVHNFTVPAGKTRIAVQATAAVAANDIKVHLLFGGSVVAEEDTGTSSEALNYAPTGGVPAGVYQVKICQTPNTMDVPQTPPFAYVGNFVTDDTAPPTVGLTSPRWKYHFANPDLNFVNTDLLRRVGCWAVTPGTTPPAGCDRDERNVAARAPWDYDFRANAATGTTRGNAAQTAESWGSPLTPSTPYTPVSATRNYVFPWTNHWNETKCDPTVFTHSGGALRDADIDQSIVQLFVAHNRFHDWSYMLGFTESNYNMQVNNFGNTDPSRENDPEVGNVQAGAISGGAPSYLGRDNANQIALQDGTPGITNQYLFQPIGGAFYAPCTDGTLDVGIVGHEYTHAISNRMIGGPDAGIGGAQGGAMGEAWSDLDAAEYLNAFNYVPTNDENPAAVGIYATGNRRVAIRSYNLIDNPLNYSNIGYDIAGVQVHADSEIWGGTNWELRQALIDKYNAQFPYSDLAARKLCAEGLKNPNDCAGNRRWIQIMFDSFLLQPASTSMLNARDGELAADVARFGGANQTEMWRVFARRGMGALATSNGSDDPAPIPDFSSPRETNATITFNVVGADENAAALTNARVFVGNYEVRSRHIADTDPATVVSGDPRTNINDNTAKFVAGTYNFVVQAPGYGSHRFTRTFTAGETTSVTFSLPTNRASLAKGASVTTTATVADDIAAKNNLIDDTESTGARLGTTTTPADDAITVDLQGTGAVNVTSVNVSSAGGPNNPGRFTSLRKFAIDASTNGITFTNIYISPDDAFPAEAPRPTQPAMAMRSFDVPDTMATHIRLRVLTTQCTGNPSYLGEQDNDPRAVTDCATVVPPPAAGPPPSIPTPPGTVSRATELQVFSSAPAIAASSRLECDVFDRPSGDGFVDSLDVGQIRRFSLGRDLMGVGEFQAADCSLFGTLGDGFVDSLDIAQARRYQNGLDPLQSVGGPTTPLSINNGGGDKQRLPKSAGNVRVVSQNVRPGQTIPVTIEANAIGSESIYGFTLNYDPGVLQLVPNSVKIGSGAIRQAGGECSLLENADTPGQIGFSLDCNNSAIQAGSNKQLVTMQFVVSEKAGFGATALSFNDSTAKRSVASNPLAGRIQAVRTTFTDGFLKISRTEKGSGRFVAANANSIDRDAGIPILASILGLSRLDAPGETLAMNR